MKCWWIFFHKYGKWNQVPGDYIEWASQYQERTCSVCGLTRRRYFD